MKKILLLVALLLVFLTGCAMSVAGGQGTTASTTTLGDPSTCEHSYQIVLVEPSCTEEGYTIYSCYHCGDFYFDNITPVTAHTEEVVAGTPATCTEAGLTDGVQCAECNAVLVAQETIPAGHHYEALVTPPACEAEGFTTHTCTDCGDSYVDAVTPAVGHTEAILHGVEANCRESGLTEGKQCTVCRVITQPQAVIPAGDHNYKGVVTHATCLTDGFVTFTCAGCGDSYVEDGERAMGHTSQAVAGKAATCTEAGLTNGTKCAVCHVVLTAQAVIPATGHSYTSTVVAPTCTAGGYTLHVCVDCGDYYTTNQTAAKGHTEVTVTGKAATCAEAGLTDGKKCSVCNVVTVAQTTIPTIAHSYTSTVVNPTCTAGGYTTHTCSACAYSYTSNYTNAKGHTEVTVTGKAATCTEAGLTDGKKCSVCNLVTVAQTTIPTIAHSYTSAVVNPTCTAGGYTAYTCSACAYSYTSNYTNAKGHTEVTVTGKAATCTETGLTDGKKCSVCNVVTVAQTTIAAKGHSYLYSVVSATCTEAGYTKHTCQNCSYSYTSDTVAALGHNWQEATVDAPKTCKTCGVTEGDRLPGPAADGFEPLYVHYIDVGQGDSILIQVGDCDILIDAGKSGQASTVVNYLKAQGVDDIELMINSHPDNDHYGGLPTVLNNFDVDKIWHSALTSKNTTFQSAVSNKGKTLTVPSVGTTFTYDNLKLKVLYNGSGTTNSNDSSLVLKLTYGSYNFLFTGDISSTIENKLVNNGADLKCDVLKVAHHGSKGSSAAKFLSATGAKYGVICVGAENTYGHPTSDTLNRLSSAGIKTYRTDTDGNVIFSTNGISLYTPGGDYVGGSGSSSGGSSSGSSSSGTTQYFIGNKESKVFHLPTCGHLPAASKRNTMYNYWWIINIAGYTPCGHCLKNYVP